MNLVDFDISGCDRNLSPGGHRVAGVDGQVHKHLFHLAGIRVDGSQIGAERAGQYNVITEESIQHDFHPADGFIQVQGHGLQHLPAAESKQTLCKIFGGRARIVDLQNHLAGRSGQVPLLFQDLAIAEDDAKQIIEVVRQTAG
jgi:hypothetical protein